MVVLASRLVATGTRGCGRQKMMSESMVSPYLPTGCLGQLPIVTELWLAMKQMSTSQNGPHLTLLERLRQLLIMPVIGGRLNPKMMP